ncbi:MAG: PD40 domain-containing protein, partial [Prevotella sp.]|nr:PD40 domain-containing protein [Prevotella sp.]
MKKTVLIIAAAILSVMPGTLKAQDDVNIGRQNIQLSSDLMTPEALWAMGRIGSYAASPDGSKIAFQVGYYSVKHNKSHQVLCVMNADGTGRQQLTTSAKSETDPAWLSDGRIAFVTGGEVWAMNADGTGRQQLSKTGGAVEGFKFSPDGSKVIIIKSLPYNDIIQKNPEDLPKATGRLVTDLMYRHWDHYVESIQHPFVFSVSDGFAIAPSG